MSEQSKLERANQLKEKYDMYFLTLTFTLLGLAIQTAKFGSVHWPIYAELVAWCLLAIAGLVGAMRMIWFASVLTDEHVTEDMLDETGFVKESMNAVMFVMRGNKDQRCQKLLRGLSAIQAAFFAVAIFVLIASRSYPALEALKMV